MTDFYKHREMWRDQIARDAALSPLAFRIAYIVSGFMNRTSGEAWPSQPTIASQAGVRERATRNALRDLERAGYLKIEGGQGRGHSSRYIMDMPPGHAENRRARAALVLIKPAPTHPFCEDKTGRATHENRHNHVDKTGTVVPTNLYIEPSEEPKPASPPNLATITPDARTVLFRDGLAIIRHMTGKTDGTARSLLGRWLKNVRDDAKRVMRALEDARDDRVADLVPWMEKALQGRQASVDSTSHEFLFGRY